MCETRTRCIGSLASWELVVMSLEPGPGELGAKGKGVEEMKAGKMRKALPHWVRDRVRVVKRPSDVEQYTRWSADREDVEVDSHRGLRGSHSPPSFRNLHAWTTIYTVMPSLGVSHRGSQRS